MPTLPCPASLMEITFCEPGEPGSIACPTCGAPVTPVEASAYGQPYHVIPRHERRPWCPSSFASLRAANDGHTVLSPCPGCGKRVHLSRYQIPVASEAIYIVPGHTAVMA